MDTKEIMKCGLHALRLNLNMNEWLMEPWNVSPVWFQSEPDLLRAKIHQVERWLYPLDTFSVHMDFKLHNWFTFKIISQQVGDERAVVALCQALAAALWPHHCLFPPDTKLSSRPALSSLTSTSFHRETRQRSEKGSVLYFLIPLRSFHSLDL